jgi:short chain dehydrogenase
LSHARQCSGAMRRSGHATAITALLALDAFALTIAASSRGREAPIRGKTVVITGATSGIGRVAAERLAQMGARLVLVARDRARGEKALMRLAGCGPGLAHRVYYADLCRLSEMKRVGAEIAAAEPRIDVLINNAGCLFATRQVTEDDLERTFALNHLGYFVLTHYLRDRLVAAAPARIVNTASDAHVGATLDFADLQFAQGYRFRAAYGRSIRASFPPASASATTPCLGCSCGSPCCCAPPRPRTAPRPWSIWRARPRSPA